MKWRFLLSGLRRMFTWFFGSDAVVVGIIMVGGNNEHWTDDGLSSLSEINRVEFLLLPLPLAWLELQRTC